MTSGPDDRALSRRQWLRHALAAAPTAVQTAPITPPPPREPRLVPRGDLVNVLEYEEQAARRLAPAVMSRIAGGDRGAFDRVTLHPRLMVPAVDLDLSLTLFGQPHFAPILVGPVLDQRQFHEQAERATLQGASAARAGVVVTSQSSVPYETVLTSAPTGTPVWFQVFAGEPDGRAKVDRAVKAGAGVVCVTIGVAPLTGGRVTASPLARDWDLVAPLARAAGVPLVVKGVTTTEGAKRAVDAGAGGIVVSTYGGLIGADKNAPVLSLPAIVEAVAGRVPVLVDGSIRRGTDILKALALGATAVLVGRPVMWGLAAYGADGVQGVLEMLQTELGRYMAMSGAPKLGDISAKLVRVHGAQASRPTPQASSPTTPQASSPTPQAR